MTSTGHTQLLKDSLAAIERLENRLEQSEAAKHEPIAIVGAGCRYPGGIETPQALWRNLRDGVDAVAEVPLDRWEADAYYSPDRNAPGKMITRRGGFLTQVDRFEPQFFGISPREAASMDPQQRLLLETAYEALESAAIASDKLAGSLTGVFVGITTSDYGQLLRQAGPESSDVYAATGSALNAAAGRIAFAFGFQGPCVAIDTACSSSLVAVHLACQSLRARESNLALAGGVNVVLLPDAMVLFSKWGMLAPDGRCKTFDANADGFVRAEGCAVVALRRLSDALAAGEPILAVIRGSAVNSDGRSSGLTVPSGPAQRQVLAAALTNARLEAADIDYVEAHGTGTPLGDPIEVEALAAVMGRGHTPERPLMIGSIKTGLGHTEAASGLAGLLKVVTALQHEAIPPHLHFERPNPGIAWDGMPLSVPTALTPWPRGSRVRRAGVSSFGFSGTNAHVLIEEAPARAVPAAAHEQPTVVPLSAREERGLRALAQRTAAALDAEPAISLADVALTLGTGRQHLAERVAVVAESRSALVEALHAVAAGRAPALGQSGKLNAGERSKIAFVFTGQGAQYAGMGKVLYEREPVFREALDAAAGLLATRLDKPLLELLFESADSSKLSQTAYTQPALFALEYALAQLWSSWGVTPAVVLGHSVGEYVAATVAGVMSLADGLTLIAERGRLMQSLPPGGAMAALFADGDTVARRVQQSAGRVSIAAFNGPEETVVSGDADAVAALVARAAADGIKSRSLEVSHAFHSARLDPMLDAFERSASAVRFAPPRLTLLSNLTGAPLPTGTAPDAAYWRRHAREPVRFQACVEALRAAGVTTLVEIGPHPTLLALAARAVSGASWSSAASLRRGRDDMREMLGALTVLYARGVAVDWDAVYRGQAGRRVALPTYPFQRERHWFAASTRRTTAASSGHPLLGARRDLASAPGTHTWETTLSLESHPWLRDHRVEGEAIVPATAYIEISLATGAEILGHEGGRVLRVEAIENKKPLILREGEQRTLQSTVVADASGAPARLSVSSTADSGWTEHMTAELTTLEPPDSGVQQAPLASLRERCGNKLDGAAFYAALAEQGNQWGECFQGMQEVWLGSGEAVARVNVAAPLLAEVSRYRFHPAVSDSCGHCLVAAASSAGAGLPSGAFVGGGVGEIRFYRSPVGASLWTHATLRPRPDGAADRTVVGDVRVYDEAGLVSETLGARLVYLDAAAASGSPKARDWLYEVSWKPSELPAREHAARGADWIVFADRAGIADALAARRQARGARTFVVTHGAGFSIEGERVTLDFTDGASLRRLLDACREASVIVHLSSVAPGAVETLGLGLESVVALLQASLDSGSARRAPLWLVTQDSQRALPEDVCGSPFAAALWGLGRSLSVEHAELWGGLVDVASTAGPSELAEQLEREIESRSGEDQVAWRGSRRFVARLARRTAVMPPAAGLKLRGDAAYLVTGGLGGIGLATAAWLVERGARQLVLVGRTPLPPRERWQELAAGTDAVARRVAALQALEMQGTHVESVALDVAADGALKEWLTAWRARGGAPFAGVMHAAGVVHFCPLSEQAPASLHAEVAAKIDGGWQLHRLLASEPLDWFVCFSSSSSLLRSPLLGAYAAGNAFLDALAQHRRAAGMPALSVNWGTWGEVGMAVEAGQARGGNMLNGVSVMPTAQALAALEELIGTGATQAAVMPVNWRRLATAYPTFAKDPFLSDLVAPSEREQPSHAGNGAALSALRTADDGTRPALLARYLREQAGRTLGMGADQVDPAVSLASVGFDSLMAVQLKSQIEADLGLVVPMIRFLDGPCVHQLVEAVLSVNQTGQGVSREAEGASTDAWEQGSI